MTLEDWIENNHPIRIATSKEEISGYLNKISKRLLLFEEEEEPDIRLDHLHKVLIWIALAALRAEGLKLKTESSHHILLIDSLAPTLGAQHDEIAALHNLHKQRNIEDYGHYSAASSDDVAEGHQIILKLRETLMKRLKDNHPELL